MNKTASNIIDIPGEIIPENDAKTPEIIPADRWREAIRNSRYPGHCKDTLLAFVDLIEAREWSQTEAARNVKHGPHKKQLSGPALSQLLTGTYAADPTTLCKAIDRAIILERGRQLFGVAGFVPTRLYSVLSDLADIAVLTQRIACLHGGLLIGKTTAAHALCAQYDRAATLLFTVPYADTYGGFVRRLGKLRNVPLKGTLSDIRERIIESLDSTHLLVIDEFHQPLVTYSYSQAVRCFEFIREINDIARCGILLVGSSEGHAALITDERFERLAATLTSVDARSADRDLSPAASTADLAKIAKSFALPSDPDRLQFCAQIVNRSTVSRLFDTLRLASARAERRQQALTWDHVTDVASTALKLAA